MSQATLVHELISMLKRRAWIIGLVLALGASAAVGLALLLPPKFETEAKILVESQRIPTELARSTVQSSAAERLQIIQQRLMSRDRLIAVIEKLNLFADRPDLTLLDKIEELRSATRIRPIALAGNRRGQDSSISAFTIRVTLTNPAQAAAIANEFVSIVLEQNLEARSERARQTLAFFEGEERRLGSALTTLEGEISAFKIANEDALPDSLEFRRSELARLQDNGLELDRRVLELEEQRGALEAALAAGRDPEAPTALTGEERQLRALELELAERSQVLSPSHPDLATLRRRIRVLTRFIEENPETGSALGDGADPRTAAIRRQVDLIGTQIQVIQDQQARLVERAVAIGESIQKTPQVEIALNGLERRHTELREQYAAVVRKRAEAETGAKLEANQQAERFEVIENALVPERPVSPNRKKIVALGVGASGALAAVLVLLAEMMNPAIRSSAQMERQLKLRPVVAIPYVRTRGQRRRRQRTLAAAAAVVALVVPSGLWMVDQHVRPLESVADKIVEKAGLEEMVRLVRSRF